MTTEGDFNDLFSINMLNIEVESLRAALIKNDCAALGECPTKAIFS